MNATSTAIILVKPENSDNIGAAARVMKNMFFRDLRLVSPPKGWKQKGKKMAMAAIDVLESARVFSSLEKAAADCQRVIATSRRYGSRRGEFYPLGKTLQRIKREDGKKKFALVFGRESKGLSNEDVAFCDWTTTIPTDPACPSINLAQSVAVMTFALSHGEFSISRKNEKMIDKRSDYVKAAMKEVSKREVVDVLQSLKDTLTALEYREEGPEVIDRIQATFYRMIKRAGLIKSEAQMLKGLARRIRQRATNARMN